MNTTAKKLPLLLAALGLCAPVFAAEGGESGTQVAYQREGLSVPQEGGELVLSAAPRESIEAAKAIYEPVAEYLSKVLGRKVVYKYAGNWGVYQGQMQKGSYDLVFDGAHFNGWRVEKLKHNILLKIPNELAFVVITKKDEAKLTAIQQLSGRTICAHAPPNLATLTVLKEFSNPSRQPVLMNTEGWDNIYAGVISGKCTAGALPLKFVQKNDPEGAKAKVIFKAATLPDNALSASPRISRPDQTKIVQALMAPAGLAATEKLRDAYARGKNFAPGANEEYAKLGELLKSEWGYY